MLGIFSALINRNKTSTPDYNLTTSFLTCLVKYGHSQTQQEHRRASCEVQTNEEGPQGPLVQCTKQCHCSRVGPTGDHGRGLTGGRDSSACGKSHQWACSQVGNQAHSQRENQSAGRMGQSECCQIHRHVGVRSDRVRDSPKTQDLVLDGIGSGDSLCATGAERVRVPVPVHRSDHVYTGAQCYSPYNHCWHCRSTVCTGICQIPIAITSCQDQPGDDSRDSPASTEHHFPITREGDICPEPSKSKIHAGRDGRDKTRNRRRHSQHYKILRVDRGNTWRTRLQISLFFLLPLLVTGFTGNVYMNGDTLIDPQDNKLCRSPADNAKTHPKDCFVARPSVFEHQLGSIYWPIQSPSKSCLTVIKGTALSPHHCNLPYRCGVTAARDLDEKWWGTSYTLCTSVKPTDMLLPVYEFTEFTLRYGKLLVAKFPNDTLAFFHSDALANIPLILPNNKTQVYDVMVTTEPTLSLSMSQLDITMGKQFPLLICDVKKIQSNPYCRKCHNTRPLLDREVLLTHDGYIGLRCGVRFGSEVHSFGVEVRGDIKLTHHAVPFTIEHVSLFDILHPVERVVQIALHAAIDVIVELLGEAWKTLWSFDIRYRLSEACVIFAVAAYFNISVRMTIVIIATYYATIGLRREK